MNKNRQIDILIAEKILGQKVYKTDSCNGSDNFWLDEDSTEELPFYTTSIASAMTIVEKITTDYNKPGSGYSGLGFELHYRDESSESFFVAQFWKTVCAPPFENMDIQGEGTDISMAMAICKAALNSRQINIPTDGGDK